MAGTSPTPWSVLVTLLLLPVFPFLVLLFPVLVAPPMPMTVICGDENGTDTDERYAGVVVVVPAVCCIRVVAVAVLLWFLDVSLDANARFF